MVSYKAMHDQNYLHDITDINTFCDWLSGTTMTSVYDSVHRNTISLGLLSSIVLINQSQRLFISVRGTRFLVYLVVQQNSDSGPQFSFL